MRTSIRPFTKVFAMGGTDTSTIHLLDSAGSAMHCNFVEVTFTDKQFGNDTQVSGAVDGWGWVYPNGDNPLGANGFQWESVMATSPSGTLAETVRTTSGFYGFTVPPNQSVSFLLDPLDCVSSIGIQGFFENQESLVVLVNYGNAKSIGTRVESVNPLRGK